MGGLADALLVKYSTAGDLLWSKQLGTIDRDATNDVFGDELGNIYLSGNTRGSWTAPNAGGADFALIKLSPAAAFANGSSRSSLGAGAALAISADTLSVSTAPAEKNKRIAETSTDPSAISRRANLQTSNLNLLAAATLAISDNDKETNGDYASTTASTGAIDAAFATLENDHWPKVVAEHALEI